MIGSDVVAETLPLHVEVAGTAGVERIDLLAAGRLVCSWDGSPYSQRPTNRVRIRWSGARILNRNRATVWDGALRIRGNQLTQVAGFAFDSPAEGIREWKSDYVQWTSITTGDEDGLVLTLADGLAGTLEFETGVVRCPVALADLRRAPVTREAGGVEQRVVFELAPAADVPREVGWEIPVKPDRALAVKGQIPYHLRITQVDGHRAWTSPWFVRARWR
jgi:hypothetical protein